jgi:hypothetical protein
MGQRVNKRRKENRREPRKDGQNRHKCRLNQCTHQLVVPGGFHVEAML